MTLIREEDLIESIADAFQYISYFHPPDFVDSLSSSIPFKMSDIFFLKDIP